MDEKRFSKVQQKEITQNVIMENRRKKWEFLDSHISRNYMISDYYTICNMENYALDVRLRPDDLDNDLVGNLVKVKDAVCVKLIKFDNSKKGVYQTTYEVLCGLCKLIAPLSPFTADEIYTKLTNEKSVHLADYPVCNEDLLNDTIEDRMDLVRDLISLGRNAREEAKIKVRQPISEVLIDSEKEMLMGDLVDLIKEELNVKTVKFTKDVSEYMNYVVKPNFKVAGKVFGPNIKFLGEELAKLDLDKVKELQAGNSINVFIHGEEVKVLPDYADIRISAKEGFNVAMDGNNFIILETSLTDELIEEGIAREMISKVQNLRKERDFNITDRITIYYNGDELVEKTVEHNMEFIKNETLAVSLIKSDNLSDTFDLNGHDTLLDVERKA